MFKIITKQPILFHHVIKLNLPLKISACSISSIKLEPHVSSKYSYAFGRGTIPLINENMNYFLNKLETEPKKDLIVSYCEKKIVNNHEFVQDVRRLASGIYNQLRLRKGDTICIWSLNCYDWLKIYFACQSLGITVCTVNPYYKEHELAYALVKCKAKAVFLPGSESDQNEINKFLNIFNADHVQSELKNKGNLASVIFIDQNTKQISMDFESFQLDELSIDQKLDTKLLECVDGDVPAVIMYTSGTTGVPKGVVLSMFSIINNANIASSYVESDDDNCIILPLPLFHSFALTCGAQVMACKSRRTILTGYRYNTKDVCDSIVKHNGTFLFATPTMIIDIIDYVKKNKMELNSLKTILTGAASFPSELAKSIKETLPHLQDLRIGYGLTETSPVVSLCQSTDSELHRFHTVGRPIDYVEVKIIDPNTEQIVELDQEGELCVRGHNVMVGYFEDEEKTKETITPNRWLKTGDRATMDKDGFMKICGRTKELIIKGGENIYPAEIENILQSHPNVLDAYAFRVPDKRLGEVVGCWIKLNDENIRTTEEEIQSFCKNLITGYKVPTHVQFVDSFPITSTGKVKKFEMTRITCEKLGIPYDNK